MNIDSTVVKKKREEKSWSQEHLAAVSDLSLRTVQRVEADGSASAETRMSLAAAFGIEPSELLPGRSDEHSSPRNTLCGKIAGTILTLAGILLFLSCCILAVRASSQDAAIYLRLTTGLTTPSIERGAAVVGLSGILLALAGILVLITSKYAFAFCVASIFWTLSLYTLAVILIPLRPTPSDLLVFAPWVLVSGIAAGCSYRSHAVTRYGGGLAYPATK